MAIDKDQTRGVDIAETEAGHVQQAQTVLRGIEHGTKRKLRNRRDILKCSFTPSWITRIGSRRLGARRGRIPFSSFFIHAAVKLQKSNVFRTFMRSSANP